MINEKLKGLVAVGSLLAGIGCIFLFFSSNIGISFAEIWLIRHDGVDISIYKLVQKGYINSFLCAGSILFGIGVITIIFAYYKMLNID
jgi:hypothetical protein